MQGNSSVIATIFVGVVIVGAVAYGIYSTNSWLSALSEQNTSLKGQIAGLGQQVSTVNRQESTLASQNSDLANQIAGLSQRVGVLEQHTVQVVTLTNTVISMRTTTSISTETIFVTNTIYSTVTTTSNVYPPSSSTYALTYVSGNATWSNTNCVAHLTADVTYEIHKQVSSNIIQWLRLPSGQLVQPGTQKVFTNQAYLTVFSQYDYDRGPFGPCDAGGPIASLNAFVTDTNNNQLSPSTYFIVQAR
jgi:hypothetical protein